MDTIQYQDIIFRRALASDDADLKRIMSQNDMESWVRLSFEREPSYFLADNLMGESHSVIVHKLDNPDEKMGMYACAYLPVHINGQPEYIGYLAGLRVCDAYRKKIRYLKNGYDSIRSLIPKKGTLPFWFTSIASENQAARKLLEAGLKGLPYYSLIGEMKTVAISVNQAKANRILDVVSDNDIDELIVFYHRQTKNYQFSPVITADWLRSLQGEKGLSIHDFFVVREQGNIVGCLAIWDQRPFKQTVIKGYRFPLNKLSRLYNLYASLSKRAPFPRIGSQLEQVYLSFVAFERDKQHLCVSAIQDALSKLKQKHSNMAVLGLSQKNPLMAIIEDNFHVHSYTTCIETVNWQDQKTVGLISDRVQPEIAIL